MSNDPGRSRGVTRRTTPAAVAGAITVAVAVPVHEVAEIIAVLNGLRARIGVGTEA